MNGEMKSPSRCGSRDSFVGVANRDAVSDRRSDRNSFSWKSMKKNKQKSGDALVIVGPPTSVCANRARPLPYDQGVPPLVGRDPTSSVAAGSRPNAPNSTSTTWNLRMLVCSKLDDEKIDLT